MGRSIILLAFLLIITSYGCREDLLEPVPEESERGSIHIRSNPAGARIYLNGAFTNKFTPDSLINLNAGVYNIELRRERYLADTVFQVYLQEGKQVIYNIELRNE